MVTYGEVVVFMTTTITAGPVGRHDALVTF
jgi:hypothetical protein